MEPRWTSGRVRVPAHKISAHYLASSTNIFSDGFIRSLGNDLEVNREQLARELGFLAKDGTADELYSWCNSPGSTVFVLVSVLANLGRTDCIHKIEQYIYSQTMQLFVKVEEAATEQTPATEGPLFQQIITSCEFSLLQAMENVLGQDVVYYEIVGPGSWVTWNTSTKDLKGQQLTLLHHSQPVPHTRAALCDSSGSDTELKQPVVTHNIPAVTDMTSKREIFVKANPGTEMESLKYSFQVSNSNNISLSGSLDLPEGMLQPFSADGFTKTHSLLSLGSKNGQSPDIHTRVKELIDDKQNTPENESIKKQFSDKLQCTENESKNSKQDELIHHVLDNVPNLSLLNEESSGLPSNTQGQALQSSADGKNCRVTLEGQTQCKALIASVQNTSEYPQVIKHFPDKLLYKQIESKCNNQDLLTIQRALDNVPRLSLLEEEFSSLLPDTERPAMAATQADKSDKMNNLNCGVPSSARTSMNPQQIYKTLESHVNPTETGTRSTAKQQTRSCGPTNSDPVIQMPVFSQTNTTEIEMHHTGGSFFSQEGKIPKGIIPKILTSPDFFSNAGFQPVGLQFQNSPLENDSPLLCENSYPVTTPPQKRHRLASTTPSSSISADRQQTLLDVQALKLKQLQIQQLQHQQHVSVSQQTPDNDTTAAEEIQHHQLWSQQSPDNDTTAAEESQHHQPWPQQVHTQFLHNGQIHNHHEQPLNCCSDQTLHKEHTQNLYPGPQELEHQTFHLVQHSLQQILYPQQLHDPDSNHNLQSSDCTVVKTKQTSFLNSNASPYLICHTPPPGFPEELRDKTDHGEFDESDRQDTQSQIFEMAFTNHETNPSSHFVGRIGHVTKMNTKEYMTMSHPAANNFRNPGMNSSHNNFGQFIAVQNTEFLDTNHFVNFENRMKNEFRSDSSGISVDCPTHFQGESSGIFCGHPNTFMTPQPFYPAPPIFDVLGRRIHAFAAPSISQSHQGDGHNSVNKTQSSGSKSLPVNHCQTAAVHDGSQEAELLQLDGYCQHENGDTIQDTMEKFKSQDGNYIIWKSRRFKKLIISVSYLNQLFHFRVDETKNENSDRIVYYLFEGGYKSESLLDLVKHYRQDGIRISVQSRGSSKVYIEQIYLRCPLKVKLEMKRKDTIRSK